MRDEERRRRLSRHCLRRGLRRRRHLGTERLVAQAQPEEESDAEGPDPVRVTVARPEPGEIRDNYGALGTIRAARSVDLRPLAEGRVEEVAVVSGERVAKGDLILALDDRAETAALEQARATLAEARAAFERARAEVATAEAALGISGCGRLSTA